MAAALPGAGPQTICNQGRLVAMGNEAGRYDEAAPWQVPGAAPAPPRCAPGGPGQLGTPRQRPVPAVDQPLPWVLERAASKVAHLTAFDRSGAGGSRWRLHLLRVGRLHRRRDEQHLALTWR